MKEADELEVKQIDVKKIATANDAAAAAVLLHTTPIRLVLLVSIIGSIAYYLHLHDLRYTLTHTIPQVSALEFFLTIS